MFIKNQLLAFILILHQIFGAGFAGVILRNLENCDPNEYDLFKCNLSIKTVNKSQYLSGTLWMSEPFNNSLKVTTGIELLTGKEYIYLFTIRENKACEAMHKYFGEFVYDIERGMGHIPGVCPIPKNTYHLYNLPIDASKITTASSFPFGNLRVTIHFLDRKNSEVSCFRLVAEHNLLHH